MKYQLLFGYYQVSCLYVLTLYVYMYYLHVSKNFKKHLWKRYLIKLASKQYFLKENQAAILNCPAE